LDDLSSLPYPPAAVRLFKHKTLDGGMDTLARLKSLSSQMHLEPAEDAGCSKVNTPEWPAGMVASAVLPNGQRTGLLKTLLTSACERNCYYCPFRAGRNYRRTTLKPEEMAKSFMDLYRTRVAGGLFLSSGIVAGGVHTQDKLIATAEILRKKYNYRGYLHLKIMPGADFAQVERTMQLADRVSVNLEAPNTPRLLKLAPRKEFMEELLAPLRWVEQIRASQSPHHGWNGRWSSSVTQFVVGAVGESDLELLSTTEQLYRDYRLRRAYFSAFRPIEDTPLENLPPASKLREFRLYQASFLMRDYGFSMEEMSFDAGGNLPEYMDPKLAWAQGNLSGRPVEINRADRQELLRIPGIGPKGAASILQARRKSKIKDVNDLRRIGVNPERALPFILLDGREPARQLALL
jgi:predicted DNA-binding helix-hairpin-helix protein